MKRKELGVLSNIAYFSVGKVIEMLVATIGAALTARYLGVQLFGYYSLIWAILLLLNVIPDAGLNSMVVRLLVNGKKRVDYYLGAALLVRLFLFVLIAVPTLIGTHLMLHDRSILICFYVGLVWVYARLTLSITYTVYLSFERLDLENYLTVLNSFCFLALLYGVTRTTYGIVGIFIAHGAACVLTMLLSLFIMRLQFIRPVFTHDPALWKELIRGSFFVGGSRLCKTIYTYIDAILLKVLRTAWDVGIYSGAYNIIQKLNFIAFLIARPLFPMLSWFAENDPGSLSVIIRKSLKLMLILAIPLSVATIFTAPTIIGILLGPGYEKSIPVLQLLAPVFSFSFPNAFFWFIALSLNFHRFTIAVAITAAVLNGLLDLLLIPLYGYMAPCVATLAAEIFFCAVFLWRIARYLQLSLISLGETMLMPLFAGVVMAIMLLAFTSVSLIFMLPISFGVYLIFLDITGTLRADDIRSIISLLQSRESREISLYV